MSTYFLTRQLARLTKKQLLTPLSFWQRRQWIFFIFISLTLILLWRAINLQITHQNFLQKQGEARHVHTMPINANRGIILDRHGQLLAMSTPVDSVWVNPKQFEQSVEHWPQVADLLKITTKNLEKMVEVRKKKEFVYLKRHIVPELAKKIMNLNLAGVFLQREYRRYYPTGEIAAHVVGFTDIDERGIEGLELAFNKYLKGISGTKRVVKDKQGHIIADVEAVKMPLSGRTIQLSLDLRLQYLAYRELKAAVQQNKAKAASAVILDVHTGEVLAMVNQPGYNPNNHQTRQSKNYRNRAVTDIFEPGSTLKPFTIAAALESGLYTPTTLINTHPGSLQLDKYTVKDSRNYGIIDVSTVIKYSSNVGASKIALSLPKQYLWQILHNTGFGQSTVSGFPGEVSGQLTHYHQWMPAKIATLSFGYGVNMTLLQLARAYAMLANEGILPPIRFTPFHEQENIERYLPIPVLKAETAQQVLTMLKSVVTAKGTGKLARIPNYQVAGKTGTARKLLPTGQYSNHEYFALFAGIVPANKPRLAMVVLIDTPKGASYYGGKVAAPIFASVMTHALRLLNIPPDGLEH